MAARAPGDGENPNNLGHARQEVDNAMAVMRDSMQRLADREAQLTSLQGKSQVLQGTSGAFNRQAKKLRWELRWQQYRVLVVSILSVIWIAGFYPCRNYVKEYAAITAATTFLLCLIQRCMFKRWRASMESDDTKQLLEFTNIEEPRAGLTNV
eukprot:TRINITY_DN33280_c0_g1_i1.p1 TRINITY_DN33280_c0_g1~~TRINITY_DN33280_c0_g1_i1.p1  ORF type:complete len:176 (+),score=35.20 TRINITY_DN33280_c0_g1_i1:72-530(+)